MKQVKGKVKVFMLNIDLIGTVIVCVFVGLLSNDPGWAIFSLIAVDFLIKNKKLEVMK